MNCLILTGRLVKDFERKGDIAKSSIAVSDFKGTFFVDITVFGKTVDYATTYLHKGDMVAVSGSLNIFKKDNKSYTSCSVQSLEGIGSKKEEKPVSKHGEPVEEPKQSEDIDEDLELPF